MCFLLFFFGDVIMDIVELFSLIGGDSCSHIPHSMNIEAYTLALVGLRSLGLLSGDGNNIPMFLFNVLSTKLAS